MKIQIFQGKEPYLHLFFIDYENKKFYKYWRKQFKGSFKKEVDTYKTLQDTGFTPKLYSAKEVGKYLVLETEFIPFLPVWGFGRINNHIADGGYTKEQKESIIKQIKIFADIVRNKGLADQNDNITFEFTQNNLLYDIENDKVYFYDFAYTKPTSLQFLTNMICSTVQNLPENNTIDFKITKQYIKDNWVNFSELAQDDKNIEHIKLANDLIQQLKEDNTKDIKYYHSIYVLDNLIEGQREHYTQRFAKFNIDPKDFNNKTVYDIGCNIGGNLPFYCELGASKVIGVESSKKAGIIARMYIKYINNFWDGYNVIKYINSDATQVDYNDANTIMYLSCHAHFGSKEYHQKLAKNTTVIYIEGHARGEGEKLFIEKFLPDFGDKWQWTFMGWTNESVECQTLNRPIFKGIKQ